ncbi:hypothetical protein NBH00_11920 [Paraconexibacter antarcticus]|uniref:Uncharacterized protein n=1 Tax=Paraconexibacter antarcticus TaxID=2949664 RepID=A0ABY5DXY7_9ACTN|nr:hypothetical protein [Paraconexibacter antarcticus]UTI66888.1 hypothetical protein NBH00_11920 [Paraconexibacter antarcticus]
MSSVPRSELDGPAAEQDDRAGGLARGLAARLRDASEAADRLASFAYDTRPAESPSPALADGQELATAHDFVLRTFVAVGDPLNYTLIAAASAHPTGALLDQLAHDVGLSRLALIERIHSLIQLGLVARDLQADTVMSTPAGTGILELVSGLEADVARWLSKRRHR